MDTYDKANTGRVQILCKDLVVNVSNKPCLDVVRGGIMLEWQCYDNAMRSVFQLTRGSRVYAPGRSNSERTAHTVETDAQI